MNQDAWRDILSDWKRRMSGYQDAQYENASRFEKRHFLLGIPAIAFAAIAGTTVFANLGKDFSTTARLIVAFISITTAVLTAIQTFLNYGKRAKAHRSISHQFGSLPRDRYTRTISSKFRKRNAGYSKNLNSRIGEITKDAPLIEARRLKKGTAVWRNGVAAVNGPPQLFRLNAGTGPVLQ